MGGVFPNNEGGGDGPGGRRIKKPREDWHHSRGEAGPGKALALAGMAPRVRTVPARYSPAGIEPFYPLGRCKTAGSSLQWLLANDAFTATAAGRLSSRLGTSGVPKPARGLLSWSRRNLSPVKMTLPWPYHRIGP